MVGGIGGNGGIGGQQKKARKARERAGDENYHRIRKQNYKKAKKGSSYDTVPFIDVEGVDMNVERGNCSAQRDPTYHTSSIAKWFQDAGRSTGLVTTTRVTHATPAALYAHIADREWEDDHEVRDDKEDPQVCDDIAEHLIMKETGRNLKVIMGGGRRGLLPNTVKDVEEGGKSGYRRDGRNLIQEWQRHKTSLRPSVKHSYVWNRDDLLALDTSNTDYLLGLFGFSHMDYAVERDNARDPRLPEMTKAAIEVLQRDPNGYFLFVEGGLIDLGHHGNKGRKAVTETVELDEAVQVALSMTNPANTLIVVTADHAHSLSINGYPTRHTDILGIAETSDMDYLPYTTLLYGNGPGFQDHTRGMRPDITDDDLLDPNYRQSAAAPRESAAHSGDDVGLWASGPHAHLFTGVHEQSYIAHALAYAACVGEGLTFCGGNRFRRMPSSGGAGGNGGVGGRSTGGNGGVGGRSTGGVGGKSTGGGGVNGGIGGNRSGVGGNGGVGGKSTGGGGVNGGIGGRSTGGNGGGGGRSTGGVGGRSTGGNGGVGGNRSGAGRSIGGNGGVGGRNIGLNGGVGGKSAGFNGGSGVNGGIGGNKSWVGGRNTGLNGGVGGISIGGVGGVGGISTGGNGGVGGISTGGVGGNGGTWVTSRGRDRGNRRWQPQGK
ncbi:hypothetical protein Pmani_030549 [Petrolisthes manimaculis]|uniref:alkaline phosphatase n=1 Tax=Petrolisthes manimaculis TaxID=1843537 RepID=A0AAE1NX61_9EUCA|nr:hypothetical protein Pmani_030549 [Petrolisthes manimaculis]